MSTRTSPWPAGVPCWADLMVPDVREATAFYSAVLGWTVPEPDEEWGGYVVAHVDGAATAGLGPQEAGARTAWTLYFATDDADLTAKAITAAGGTVQREPVDVGPLGRMCLATDPSGATFGLWRAGTMIGSALVNEPGGLTWEDLRSTDTAAALPFYETVFGYRLDPVPGAPGDYRTFTLPDEQAPLGGMGGPMGEDAASHWLVYFSVADVDAAVASAEQRGGGVLAAPFDSHFGRMARIADPYGAELVLMTLPADRPQPDRAG